MAHIHWYPGHIAKAEKKLKEQLGLVDVVIEVLDSRIPLSSMYPEIDSLIGDKPRLILLNKADLVEASQLRIWKSYLEFLTKQPVLLTSFNSQKDMSSIVNKVDFLAKPKIDKLVQKGLLPRAARVMVVGMPNVGKSSVINRLIKKTKAKTGAKAGVTRQQQWVRIHPKIDLLDTPGIIPLKQQDQKIAQKLAFVNSISENAYNHEEVARELLLILDEMYPEMIREHYKLDKSDDLTLENIAIKRNWLVSSAQPDVERCSGYVLCDFRDGRTGRMILDVLPENPD